MATIRADSPSGIVGIIVGMQLIHSDLHDFWPWWFGTIVGGMVLLSLGWLIVAIFALLFQWGLGFGYGWDTSLIVAVMSYFTIVGLIHLCYVCIVAYKIPVRKATIILPAIFLISYTNTPFALSNAWVLWARFLFRVSYGRR